MWAADTFDDVDGDTAIVVGTVAPVSARRAAAAAEATGDPVDHVGSPNSGDRTPTGGGLTVGHPSRQVGKRTQ